MSDKKTNPLLDDEGQTAENAKEPGKKPEAIAKAPAGKPATPKGEATLKAEAVAKFPQDIVAQTKYILDNSEHISFLVPQLEGEIGVEEVQINGYKLTIKKNVPVSIPKQVAALIAEKYKINMEAGADKKIDRATDVSEALG